MVDRNPISCSGSRFSFSLWNSGDGIWFDWMNSGNRVSDSLAAFNSGTGIHTEVVEGTVIENNVVVGNLQRGIYHRQGSNNTIAFNFVSHNAMDGIAVIDEGQRIPGSSFNSLSFYPNIKSPLSIFLGYCIISMIGPSSLRSRLSLKGLWLSL